MTLKQHEDWLKRLRDNALLVKAGTTSPMYSNGDVLQILEELDRARASLKEIYQDAGTVADDKEARIFEECIKGLGEDPEL